MVVITKDIYLLAFNNGFTMAWIYSSLNMDTTTLITYPVTFNRFVRIVTSQYHTSGQNTNCNNSLEPGNVTLSNCIIYDFNYGKNGLIVCIGV